MSTEDKYNGWANRETWALDLWLSNDEGTYNYVQEAVNALALEPEDAPHWIDTDTAEFARWRAQQAGEAIKALTEEMFDPSEHLMKSEDIITWLSDIGSLYRVDWDEIGAAWLDES